MNSHDTTLTTKQERGIILTKGSVFMKKLKKWQKIVIGVLVALIVVIGGLKIFKRPILSAVLSEDEQFQYDAYCKGKRALKNIGLNMDCDLVFVLDETDDSMLISSFYSDKLNQVQTYVHYLDTECYYNEDMGYAFSAMTVEFDDDSHLPLMINLNEKGYDEFPIETITRRTDLFEFYTDEYERQFNMDTYDIKINNNVSQLRQSALESGTINKSKTKLRKIEILYYIFR